MANLSDKSRGTAILLWLCCFFGFCGLHRIYIGKVFTGILMFFTGGFLGLGQFFDLLLLLCNLLRDGQGRKLSC